MMQVLKQQAEGVRGLLPSKQQQAQHSRVKVETMRDSLWEAEEAAIQAKAKLDEIEAAVRTPIARAHLQRIRVVILFLPFRSLNSRTCCRFRVCTGWTLKRGKST